MISALTKQISRIADQWACILSNGHVVSSSFKDEKKNLIKLIKILRVVINEIEVGSVMIARDLIIFRISFNFFVFIKGDLDKNRLKDALSSLKKNYQQAIEKQFENISSVEVIEPRLVLFSMGLGEGPEPVAQVTNESYSSEQLLKVSMKTLLLLSVESQGAMKSMISFQPYVELDSLGIVHLFQIEDKEARGGAYDSAITVLVDYNLRAIIYDNYAKIESYLTQARKHLVKEYNGKKGYDSALTALKENLKSITYETVEKNEDLKAEMMRQIKKLAQL